MIFAGIPTATAIEGIFLVTIEPAPITAPLPICTPERITLFAPIQQSSSITISAKI
jgi:hypothetical protein